MGIPPTNPSPTALDVDPRADWAPRLGAKKNLTVFLERHVLARLDRPVLLLFDEADLTFPYRAVCEALFSTL
jgi:AAA-like domain